MKKWLNIWLTSALAILMIATVARNEPISLPLKDTKMSWSYYPEGSPKGLVGIASPVISYQINIKGADDDYQLQMLLNGKKVKASYDPKTGLLTYKPNKLSGKQTVNVQLIVYEEKALDISWNFTVDTKTINPFLEKDMNVLSTVQEEAVQQINSYRTTLKLNTISKNPVLQKSSQAHSNYLAAQGDSGHDEFFGVPGFTGENPWNRAAYFGYLGTVGEGITYKKVSGHSGIVDLMDAPYHRLSIIDPFVEEAGVGFNKQGDIVVNYGNPTLMDKPSQIVLYPHNGQNNVKNSWFVAETPNPLRFYQLSDIFVGYPISYAYFSKNKNDQLIVEKVSLTNVAGKAVPFYPVTPSIDDHGQHHVFIIPKAPLQPGTKYKAVVSAKVKTENGTKDVSKIWTFTTAGKLAIKDIYFIKHDRVNFIQVDTLSGDDPNQIVTIEKNGKKYLENRHHQQVTYKTITPGTYVLKINSPLFKEVKKYTITISKNTAKRMQNDGDWVVKW
ncbi:CAP domain-containing protein [Bacillus sp. CGMCC 1.16607]|uniref:CAP domain-containing protein n=1 Tax=Bacillus sp. CGMCC 1.16607 TaxID=3351842 RepID=UPI00363B0334